jgi:predicted GNAT family acetyltransferase
MRNPTIDEYVALDMLTLREHTERAGDELNAEKQRTAIENSLKISRVCFVRRNEALVAYAMLQPESATRWFITGFNTHPMHRTAPVLRDLLSSLSAPVSQLGIAELKSNVYKTNHLSMAFHKRLGFHITRENEKGVEFLASVAELASNPSIERTSPGKPGAASHLKR